MRLLPALAASAFLCVASVSAQANGPAPGEYVCKEMKGTFAPCTPVHLTIVDDKNWTWGARKGAYGVLGHRNKFEGQKRGPVIWGAAHYDGDSVMFVDGKITAVFKLQKAAR
ncbi:MAG: hypothetical protein WCJ87_12200 [Burkholderiales bacterium]